MKELVGTVVKEVYLDSGTQHYMLFKTDLFDCAFIAEGDCCSESWFSAVAGLENLIGYKVREVVEVTMGSPADGKSRQECDQLYRITLVTKWGACDIEFRNSSNGYYGGWVSCIGDGVPKDVTMTRIEEDFST